MSLALFAVPSAARSVTPPPSSPPASPPAPLRPPTPVRLLAVQDGPVRHDSTASLAGRLNREWEDLAAGPAAAAALGLWAPACPALTGLNSLDDVLSLITAADPATRDAVLIALIRRAQVGDELAGRTVLQMMLGKAVRVAGAVAGRDDVRGDQEEALARAVAALWQAIATYPVALRPVRIVGNLALNTLAITQRGHTGSSYVRRAYQEVLVADIGSVRHAVQHDCSADDVHGPVDAQLLTVLAWAVRTRVVDLDDALLLVRVYGVDEHGRPANGRAVAQQAGLAWPALRQRCRRLAQRIGAAAIDAGLGAGEPPTRSWTLVA